VADQPTEKAVGIRLARGLMRWGMLQMLNTTGPFCVVVTKEGGVRVEDLRTGLGWTLTNEEAHQLVDAIMRKLGEKTKG